MEHLHAYRCVLIVQRTRAGQHDNRREARLVQCPHCREQVRIGASELRRAVDVENGVRTHVRLPITCAGFPTATAPAGTSRVTTAPAPITAPAPMCTPSSTITLLPSQQPSPTVMPRRLTPCWLMATCGSAKRWFSARICT